MKTVLLQDVINETGAIHAAVSGISRAIRVSEILSCQFEPGVDNLPHFRRIIFVISYFVRRNTDVRRAFFFPTRKAEAKASAGFRWSLAMEFLRLWGVGDGRVFFRFDLGFGVSVGDGVGEVFFVSAKPWALGLVSIFWPSVSGVCETVSALALL